MTTASYLVNALEEIAKGEGRFSRDHLTHCTNTVEDMKEIAEAALTRVQEDDSTTVASKLLDAADALISLHGAEPGAVSSATVHEAIERLRALVTEARGEKARA